MWVMKHHAFLHDNRPGDEVMATDCFPKHSPSSPSSWRDHHALHSHGPQDHRGGLGWITLTRDTLAPFLVARTAPPFLPSSSASAAPLCFAWPASTSTFLFPSKDPLPLLLLLSRSPLDSRHRQRRRVPSFLLPVKVNERNLTRGAEKPLWHRCCCCRCCRRRRRWIMFTRDALGRQQRWKKSQRTSMPLQVYIDF